MKTVSSASAVAAALLLAHLHLSAAEIARFRYLSSVYADEKGAGLHLPEAVACDARGRLIVGDTGNDRLVRFAYQEKTVSGGREIKIPELAAPTRIQLTSKGEIYALDGRQRRIVRLDAEGQFKGAVSFDGAPPPSTIVPKSFRVDASDNLYVLDAFSARVLVLDAAGQFQKALQVPAEAGFVSDVSVESGANVLLLDSIGRRLYSAAKDATSFAPLGGDLSATLTTLPTYLTASKGTLFIVDGSAGTIVSLRRDGSFVSRQLTPGRNEGSLEHPSQMCINENDEVFIADRDNSRIQVFGLVQ